MVLGLDLKKCLKIARVGVQYCSRSNYYRTDILMQTGSLFTANVLSGFSHVRLFVTLWTTACQASLSTRILEWVAISSSRELQPIQTYLLGYSICFMSIPGLNSSNGTSEAQRTSCYSQLPAHRCTVNVWKECLKL